jgi:hypothetical protein
MVIPQIVVGRLARKSHKRVVIGICSGKSLKNIWKLDDFHLISV